MTGLVGLARSPLIVVQDGHSRPAGCPPCRVRCFRQWTHWLSVSCAHVHARRCPPSFPRLRSRDHLGPGPLWTVCGLGCVHHWFPPWQGPSCRGEWAYSELHVPLHAPRHQQRTTASTADGSLWSLLCGARIVRPPAAATRPTQFG